MEEQMKLWRREQGGDLGLILSVRAGSRLGAKGLQQRKLSFGWMTEILAALVGGQKR